MAKGTILFVEYAKIPIFAYKNTFMHPLIEQEELIKKRGMLILSNVSDMPLYNEAYISNHLVVSLCHSGYIDAEYDMRKVNYGAKEISVVYPNHAILTRAVSPDYRATLLVLSGGYFEKWKSRMSFYGGRSYHEQPAIHLSESQYVMICSYMEFMKSVLECDCNALQGDASLAKVVEMLSYMLGVLRNALGVYNEKVSLYNRFYDCLVRYYKVSRSVSFYAEKMCLSPKYFGTVIRKETGLYVGKCISGYVVMQAKNILNLNRDMNIQQISQMLGFEDQASFSRYFRTETGMSPSEYRQSLQRIL